MRNSDNFCSCQFMTMSRKKKLEKGFKGFKLTISFENKNITVLNYWGKLVIVEIFAAYWDL